MRLIPLRNQTSQLQHMAVATMLLPLLTNIEAMLSTIETRHGKVMLSFGAQESTDLFVQSSPQPPRLISLSTFDLNHATTNTISDSVASAGGIT